MLVPWQLSCRRKRTAAINGGNVDTTRARYRAKIFTEIHQRCIKSLLKACLFPSRRGMILVLLFVLLVIKWILLMMPLLGALFLCLGRAEPPKTFAAPSQQVSIPAGRCPGTSTIVLLIATAASGRVPWSLRWGEPFGQRIRQDARHSGPDLVDDRTVGVIV